MAIPEKATPEEIERLRAAGHEVPENAEVLAMDFNPIDLLERYPNICKGCVHVLEAFQKEHPTLTREVCAVMALQFMEIVATPNPGHEQAFYADIQWLREQAGPLQVIDQTGGALEAAKGANRKDWRQT